MSGEGAQAGGGRSVPCGACAGVPGLLLTQRVCSCAHRECQWPLGNMVPRSVRETGLACGKARRAIPTPLPSLAWGTLSPLPLAAGPSPSAQMRPSPLLWFGPAPKEPASSPEPRVQSSLLEMAWLKAWPSASGTPGAAGTAALGPCDRPRAALGSDPDPTVHQLMILDRKHPLRAQFPSPNNTQVARVPL